MFRLITQTNKSIAMGAEDKNDGQNNNANVSKDEKPHEPVKERFHLMQETEFLILVCVVSFIGIVVLIFLIYRLYLKWKMKRADQTYTNRSHTCCNNDNLHPPAYSIHDCHRNGRPEVNTRYPPCHAHCSCYVIPSIPSMGMPGHGMPYPAAFHRYNNLGRGCCENVPEVRRTNATINIDQELPLLTTCNSVPVNNPAYEESLIDESLNGSISNIRTVMAGPLKDLYSVTERSFTQTVCGKLVVSLAHVVDYRGDTLYLDNMGISLNVPKGALKREDSQMITLVLNWDLSDNPEMSNEQSLVSPVVYVGPHGLKLEKPCTLSFRHCSFDPRHIRVMRSETELNSEKSWEAICDRDDATGSCNLTPDECQIKIDTFTLYTCIQTPLGNQQGKKWLQLAVFACPLRKEINHHQIRVYFLNKTPCALQWAIQNEANFGGKLVCPEKAFLFDGCDYDMFAKTRYISDGWELVDPSNFDKIAFLNIWHGHCPHISVCYKRRHLVQTVSKNRQVAIEMSLHLTTYQSEHEDDGEKLVIQVFEDNQTPVVANEHKCDRHHVDDIEIHVNNFRTPKRERSRTRIQPCTSHAGGTQGSNTSVDSSKSKEVSNSSNDKKSKIKVVINNKPEDDVCDNIGDLATGGKRREVSHELRRELKLLLDPGKPLGTDWRDLASKLELDRCIPKLESYESPTEMLLNYVEHRDMSLTQLQYLFRSIDREDCAKVVENYLRTTSHSTTFAKEREPVENAYSGYKVYRGDNHERHGDDTRDKSYDEGRSTYTGTETMLTSGSNDNSVYRYSGRHMPITGRQQSRQYEHDAENW